MPDTRGDVLCPTCGRWTPPAPFCTECGAALQGGFRDPVGGQGSDVFRRGHEVDRPGAPWSAPAERFEPEPEDQAARAAAAGGSAGAPRVDNLDEAEERVATPSWPAEPGLSTEPSPAADEAAAEKSADEERAAEEAAASGAAAASAAAAATAAATPATATPAAAAGPGSAPPRRSRAPAAPTRADQPTIPPPVMPPPPPPPPRLSEPSESPGGMSGPVFVVILGLMFLALLGGAIVGGFFDAGPTGEASPSPTAVVSTPTAEPTPEPSSPGESPTPSAAPTPIPSDAEPTTFPDGFVARAESCDEEPAGPTCDNSGAVNDGDVWVLVSFRHAKPTDVIGVSIFDSDGDPQGSSSLELSFCGSNTDCAGYTYFLFTNLDPGHHDVRVTRNGAPAATTSFTVE